MRRVRGTGMVCGPAAADAARALADRAHAASAVVVAGGVVVVVALALAVPPARADFVQELSSPTPFPSGCGVTGAPTFNSTAEPSVVVNPVNPANIVDTWQQDRFTAHGGALSNAVSVSK